MRFEIYRDRNTMALYAKRLWFFGLIKTTVFEKRYEMDFDFTTRAVYDRIEADGELMLRSKLRKRYDFKYKDEHVSDMKLL